MKGNRRSDGRYDSEVMLKGTKFPTEEINVKQRRRHRM